MTALHVERRAPRRGWRLWEATGREPFAHPAYVGLRSATASEPVAVCWSDGGGEVLLPLLLRPLPDEPWARRPGRRLDRRDVAVRLRRPVRGRLARPGGVRGCDLLTWMRDDAGAHRVRARRRWGSRSPESGAGKATSALHLADNVVVDLTRSPRTGGGTTSTRSART